MRSGAWSTSHVRERVQRSTSVERSGAERGRERTIPAAVLDLQRSAGNAATARLLQRAREHTQYAPLATQAIAPKFRDDHFGETWEDAVAQHGRRGTYATNTVVNMTGDDAHKEIFNYLNALHWDVDISAWTEFNFVTRDTYWCIETTLLDNDMGLYRVREVLATVGLTAWWNQQRGVFWIGHMSGVVAAKPRWGRTYEVQVGQTDEMEGIEV